MATQMFVPGPAFLYLAPAASAFGGAVTYSFLGQTEGDLQISEHAAEEDVHVDQTGPRIPFDVLQLGKEAHVGGTLVKYDEAVWQILAARIKGGVFGAIQANEIGTLIRTERKHFLLAVACPYAAKTVMNQQPAGYTFMCGYLQGAWDATLSTMRKRQRFAMRFIPEWATDGSGVLVTATLPGSLPAIA